MMSLPSPPSMSSATVSGSPADAPKMSSPPSIASSIFSTPPRSSVSALRVRKRRCLLVLAARFHVSLRLVPVTLMVSRPSPPSNTSLPSLGWKISGPELHTTTSLPASPKVVSVPRPGSMVSVPGPPWMISLPEPPLMVSLPSPPRRRVLSVSVKMPAVSSIVTVSLPPPASTSIIVKVERWNWPTIDRPFQTSIRSVSTDMRRRMASVAPSPFTRSRPPETVAVTAAPAGEAVPRHTMVSRDVKNSGAVRRRGQVVMPRSTSTTARCYRRPGFHLSLSLLRSALPSCNPVPHPIHVEAHGPPVRSTTRRSCGSLYSPSAPPRLQHVLPPHPS